MATALLALISKILSRGSQEVETELIRIPVEYEWNISRTAHALRIHRGGGIGADHES